MNSASLSIRYETEADWEPIRRIDTDAFGQDVEAALVDALRDASHLLLSLVAEVDGDVVGHIVFSPMTVGTELDTNVAICLGPMAVAPEHQNLGIGSHLVEAGLDELRRLVSAPVFLLGDAAYYGRFGFRPASEFDVNYPEDTGSLLALELTPGALKDISGTVKFAPEYNASI